MSGDGQRPAARAERDRLHARLGHGIPARGHDGRLQDERPTRAGTSRPGRSPSPSATRRRPSWTCRGTRPSTRRAPPGSTRRARAVAALLNAGSAVDLVDPSPAVTNNAPAVFPHGTTTVTFTATDATGNAATKAFRVTVANKPAAGGGGGGGGGGGSVSAATQPKAVDTTPPANPGGVVAKPGPGYVRLSWKLPADKDFDHVQVFRSSDRGTSGPAESSVYSGKGTSFVDRRVTVGTRYRYVVASFDTAGNRSAGTVATATAEGRPPARAGGRLEAEAPRPCCAGRRSRGRATTTSSSSAARRRSSAPGRRRRRCASQPAWRYEGKRYTLAAGTYHWYVWPGVGVRSAGRYGPLMGDRLFTLAKTSPRRALRRRAPARRSQRRSSARRPATQPGSTGRSGREPGSGTGTRTARYGRTSRRRSRRAGGAGGRSSSPTGGTRSDPRRSGSERAGRPRRRGAPRDAPTPARARRRRAPPASRARTHARRPRRAIRA